MMMSWRSVLPGRRGRAGDGLTETSAAAARPVWYFGQPKDGGSELTYPTAWGYLRSRPGSHAAADQKDAPGSRMLAAKWTASRRGRSMRIRLEAVVV
jgi:hypothetical protein